MKPRPPFRPDLLPRWTDEEEQRVTAAWREGGMRAAMAAVPGRSCYAIRTRLHRLGVTRSRVWTGADVARLRELWGVVPMGEIGRALGRSMSSVADKAYALGLRSGIQQGYESIPTAAARLGYEIATLKRVLKWSNVPIVEPPGRTSGPTRKRNFCVEIEAATLAAQRWVASETVTAAARARGISGGTLKRWLRQAGHRNTRVAGQVWRLPSELIDRVVRERRSSETCREAAARVGVHELTMRDWLLRAGVRPGRSGTWQVPREVVDRVAAERIATSRVPSIRAKAASAA